MVEFVVERTGTVSNVRAIKDIGAGTGKAAEQVVKACSRWASRTAAWAGCANSNCATGNVQIGVVAGGRGCIIGSEIRGKFTLIPQE